MGGLTPSNGIGDGPLVSVCIANYNGMALIDDCLRSVLAQAGNIAVEILLHDDASSDGSAAYIRDRYPVARLIVSENNVGFCIANNRMAAAAKGKYLLLLNNDAALYPDALQTLLAEADRLDRPAILSLPQYDAASGELIDRGCLLDPFFNPVPNLDPTRSDVAMVIGACLWIPKALWDELGGFPEWFGSIAEDMYLCCRARLAGYAVRALTESGYRHRVGWSFGGGKATPGKRLVSTRRRRALSERNKTFVMMVCFPAPWLAPALLVHLLTLALEAVVLSLLKRDAGLGRDIYLACFRAIWVQRDQLAQLRKAVQAGATIGLPAFLGGARLLPYKLEMLLRHGLPDVRG
jgi:GT2 family glycosyltransferase